MIKRFLAASAALLLAIAPASANELATVKLGMSKLGAMTNIWIASKTGIFKKHGLDLQVTEIPMNDQTISLLHGRKIDIALQIPGTAMVAKEAGFDLVLVGQNETAGTTPPVSNAVMASSSSSIKSMADLRGKRVSTASPRGQSFAALKELLQRNGVPVDQIQIVAAPFAAAADLLRSGQADAAVTLDPYTTQISKAGYGRPLSWFMIETIPDQPVGAWWALRSWAEKNPKLVAAFQAAVKESHDYLKADPERARSAVSEYSGLDRSLVDDMPQISWKSEVDPQAWQAVADLLFKHGELRQRHDVSEYLLKQE
jgi:NitT/TauT family transport system substrate-binding protein